MNERDGLIYVGILLALAAAFAVFHITSQDRDRRRDRDARRDIH